jgi:cell division protein FtsX
MRVATSTHTLSFQVKKSQATAMTHELATFLIAALCFVSGCGLVGYRLSQQWPKLQHSSPTYLQARLSFLVKIIPASLLLAIAMLLLAIGLFSHGT